jgi:hypothetical protein
VEEKEWGCIKMDNALRNIFLEYYMTENGREGEREREDGSSIPSNGRWARM